MTPLSLLFGVLLDAVIPMPAVAGEALAAEAASGIQPHSAVLETNARHLYLQPVGGAAVDIRVVDETCQRGPAPPTGLWLVTRDGEGRPELVAPSATPLPRGHRGRIRLLPCDRIADAGEDARLVLPEPVIDLLTTRAGLLLITD